MNDLVTQGRDLLQRELLFIQSFPTSSNNTSNTSGNTSGNSGNTSGNSSIMEVEAEELLKEADSLVAGQDQLTQMETECALIEEKLLERQIQQEAFGGPHGGLEYGETLEEKTRLLKDREEVLAESERLQPVLNILYLQLQLLENIQDSNKVGVASGCGQWVWVVMGSLLV